VTIIGFCGRPCPCEPTLPEWHCCITKPLSWQTKKFEVLQRNLEETLKELWRNFKGTLKETLKYTSKFFGEIFSLFSVPWSFFAQPCL
jgi:hypothetical protein